MVQMFNIMKEGRLIDAVKLYRELTNAPLKDAKEAVEILIQRPNNP